MATKEQIESVLVKMEKAHPVDFFKQIDDTNAGIGAVLRLLYAMDEDITAGKISDALNISTARVAVLLKKMVAKGLITKEPCSTDGRVTVVRLTEHGKKIISEMQADLYAQMSHIIDTVGEERILEFIAISEEIRIAARHPNFQF